VLSRRARPSAVRRVELFSMGARIAMLVLIAENGRVEQRMIPLDAAVTDKDIDRLGERLASELHGVTLEQASRRLTEMGRGAPAAEHALFEAVSGACQSLLDADEHVFIGGVANLAGEAAFERESLSRLYETLERETAMLEILASMLERPMDVRIGSELASEDLRGVSVVVANFTTGPDASGSVGVIGPTRMDYDRVIATANAMARLLEATLGAPDQLT